MYINKYLLTILFMFFLSGIVSAQTVFSDCTVYGNCKEKVTEAFNNNTVNVNNSQFLRGYTPFNLPYLISEVDPIFTAWLATNPLSSYLTSIFSNSRHIYITGNNTINFNSTDFNQTYDSRYLTQGGGKVFYFLNQSSDIVGKYNVSLTPPITRPQAVITGIVQDGETIIASWLSNPENYTVTTGERIFTITANVSNIVKPTKLRGYIYLTDLNGNNPVLLRNISSIDTLGLTPMTYRFSGSGTQLVINDTTRVLFQIATNKEATGVLPSISLYVDDDTFSGLSVPVPTSSTPDLSNYVQYNIPGTGNITTLGYSESNTTSGTIGSGITWMANMTGRSTLFINYSGLSVTNPTFVARLIYANGTYKYCSIPSQTVTIPDNTNSVYYIDFNCNIQHTDLQTYKVNNINPGGITFYFNAMAHSGSIEQILGATLLQKEQIKDLQLSLTKDNMKVISGFGLRLGTWKNFSIDSGQYQYVKDIVNTTLQNTSNLAQHIEWIYHTGASTWGFTDGHELNVSTCDTGSGIADCTVGTGSNAKWRRHFIGSTGHQNGVDNTELHELLPLQNVYYSPTSTATGLDNCLNTVVNPLTYSLPAEYTDAFVLLYAYCAKADDTSWNPAGFIDLRTVKSGTASGGVDTSLYMRKDGSTPMTGNLNMSNNNITDVDTINMEQLCIHNCSTYRTYFNGSIVITEVNL